MIFLSPSSDLHPISGKNSEAVSFELGGLLNSTYQNNVKRAQ
jgi:hypothetical protein